MSRGGRRGGAAEGATRMVESSDCYGALGTGIGWVAMAIATAEDADAE